MTKILNCRDSGFDCEGVVRAETTQGALQRVAQHAKEAHGVEDVPAEVVAKVHEVMLEG